MNHEFLVNLINLFQTIFELLTEFKIKQNKTNLIYNLDP